MRPGQIRSAGGGPRGVPRAGRSGAAGRGLCPPGELQAGAASAGEQSQAPGGKGKEREGWSLGAGGDTRSGTSLSSFPALRLVPAVRRERAGAGVAPERSPSAAGSPLSASPGGCGLGGEAGEHPAAGAGWKFTGSVLGEAASEGARQEAEAGRGAAEHHLAGNARGQMTVSKGGSRYRCRERSEPRRSGSSSLAPPGGDGGGRRRG